VAEEVKGYCLDVGCGSHNLFISRHLNGNGKGIDIFPYEGLSEENIVADMKHFPFGNAYFESITFIANINHVPRSQRDSEIAEAWRCLKVGGNIIVTMGNPIAEILMHKVVWGYDRLFGTHYDVDTERGMHEEEDYFLTDSEIIDRLKRAGFEDVEKKYFWTQWGLNHLLVAWKRA